MSLNNRANFSNGLGLSIGVTGAFFGLGIANENPEMHALLGICLGTVIGYILGKIISEIINISIQLLIIIVSAIYIIYRVYNLVMVLNN